MILVLPIHSAILEKTDNVYDFFKTPKLRNYFLDTISVDSVKDLTQVNKCNDRAGYFSRPISLRVASQ